MAVNAMPKAVLAPNVGLPMPNGFVCADSATMSPAPKPSRYGSPFLEYLATMRLASPQW